jgi:spore coat polysaccharide biosynthesis predicted glycosyltransferase SpsG
MTLNIYCKASSNVGLGHLIRSYSFINQVLESYVNVDVTYFLIGDVSFAKLIKNSKIDLHCFENESDIANLIKSSDVSIIDMLEIDEHLLNIIKKNTKKTAILSPVFNHFEMIDIYFGRTKYLNFKPNDFPNLKVYAGLEYAIIQKNCNQINSGVYEENLKNVNFPIAISMGGGDAYNKTLEVLRALKKCRVNATFWVMVGEGYKHSFNDLIDEIRKDTSHEIILAKTNSSMWNILKNCVLCILPGGITSYEAVYAGLPTINFFEQESQQFLLQELVEHKATLNFGLYSTKTLDDISNYIEKVYLSKKELLQMHVNTKFLIDGYASNRIFNIMLEYK